MAREMMSGWCRLYLFSALLGCGAGTLGACSGEPPPPLPAPAPVQPPQYFPPKSSLQPVVPRPAHKPTPPPAPGGPTPEPAEETQAMIEPQTAPPPPGPDAAAPLKVQDLIGLDQPAATRLFGPAAERLEEPPATVWRYRSVGCELDLFFYLDLRSGRMRTLHYALKGDASSAVRQQDCVRSLLASR